MRDLFQPELLNTISSGAVLTTLLVAASAMWLCARSRAEVRALHREMYGALRKIEGLTARRREQMLRHYDAMLEQLTRRLPTAVAAGAGEAIFETESKILARLAELEPQLEKDGRDKQRLEELIRSMERLEQTVVNVTADTVQRALIESREAIRLSERPESDAEAA